MWRKRWKAKQDYLTEVECGDTRAALRRAIETVLADRPRKGRDAKFTTDQQAAVVAIACEGPDVESERPISHWTHQEIADEVVRRILLRWNEKIKAFYQHLRSQGKPAKVAIVACMRKLLTILNLMVKTNKNGAKINSPLDKLKDNRCPFGLISLAAG